ncbi:MAG: FAD-dependent oxidoreductase, partial [Planctomycetes bacterium]|nr:FAD-dependent oxidoreductase [Planctomycetota bacterium]
MIRTELLSLLSLCLALLMPGCRSGAPATSSMLAVDVCVYGATSAGIVAAIEARQQGRTVLLLDADGWVGGLTTSGLG